MRCKNCNVEVSCKAVKCPLCHEPLICEGEIAFPTPTPKVKKANGLLKMYVLLALFVTLVCIALNVVIDASVLWCIPVAAALFYGYYLFGVLFAWKRRWHRHILGQQIVHTIAFVVVKLTMKNHPFFAYWLPVVFLITAILTVIFLVRSRVEAPKYIAATLFSCLLGVLPLIFCFVFRLSRIWPSVVSTVISVLLFVIILIVYRKNVKAELKKAFHS